MTYICDLENKLIREKAEMKEPKSYTGHPNNHHEIDIYILKLREYENHILSLKTYPIIGENWVDKKEYRDSEIEIEYCSCRRPTGSVATTCFQSCGKEEVARLKQPIETQEMIKSIIEQSKGVFIIEINPEYYNKLNGENKGKSRQGILLSALNSFSITRKLK